MTDLNPDTPYVEAIEKARTMYFAWLCSIVRLDEDEYGDSFIMLAQILHSIEFSSPLEMDRNRADDGMDLREEWFARMEDAGYDYPLDALDGPCSVLEMLIGLADRCERQIMWDPEYNDRTYKWFYEMLYNLLDGNRVHLEDCSDDVMDLETMQAVRHAVDVLLDRTYEPSGYGGLFPLHNPRRDQTQVELWFQLNQYLMENRRF